MVDRKTITQPIEVETAKGFVFRVKPVQGGLGLAVIPILSKSKRAGGRQGGGRGPGAGRPPLPATLKLREKLEADAKEGLVKAPSHYVEFLQQLDPAVKPGTARQRVYKERAAILDAHPSVEVEKPRRRLPVRPRARRVGPVAAGRARLSSSFARSYNRTRSRPD